MNLSKLLLPAVAMLLLTVLSACGGTGYGRYWLAADVDSSYVEIDGHRWKVVSVQNGQSLALASDHPYRFTFGRGIERKFPQWFYIHQIKNGNLVEVTFERQNEKTKMYPLYVGSWATVFQPFGEVVDVQQSTNVSFGDGKWLVLHRWEANGIYADVARHLDPNDPTRWAMGSLDVLLPADGTPVEIAELGVQVTVVNFDRAAQSGRVRFTAL